MVAREEEEEAAQVWGVREETCPRFTGEREWFKPSQKQAEIEICNCKKTRF